MYFIKSAPDDVLLPWCGAIRRVILFGFSNSELINCFSTTVVISPVNKIELSPHETRSTQELSFPFCGPLAGGHTNDSDIND